MDKNESNEETRNLDNASNGDDSDQPTTSKSASFRKLFSDSDFFEQEATKATTSEEEKVTITGFRFCDMEILSSAFSSMRCADCGHFNVVLMENHLKRSGCASSLRLFCGSCGWIHEFFSSKEQGQSFEVNGRFVYAMRSIGKGHAGAKKFCALMNTPPPLSEKAYIKKSTTIAKCVKTIAKQSMADAASEIRNAINGDGDGEADVVFVGIWNV